MEFRKFFEALKFNQPNDQMKEHPFVKNGSFGIEIEFIAAAAPFNDMRPEWLALALDGTDYEEEFIKSYQHNDPEYEKVDADFVNYIKLNKKDAWRSMWDIISQYQFKADANNDNYKQIMIRYWGTKLSEIVKEAGFKILPGQKSAGSVWAYGDDGQDSEYNLPVLEIRSGIMYQKDIEKLSEVLHGFAALSKQNNKELMATGSTGLHIHVSNPNTTDGFTRLAAAQTADEEAIWDTSTSHDRNFERHAALNRPQDYESHDAKNGAHKRIMDMLWDILAKSNYPMNKGKIIDNDVLNMHVFGLNRNAGINVASEHPTVEYRYLSSRLIVENPQKAIQFIQYFINHTAAQSNKDRITFEDEDNKFILTKLPKNKIRIDFFKKKEHEQEWEDETGRSLSSTYKYPKIPRSGKPRGELDKGADYGERDIEVPFSQWFKNLHYTHQDDLKKYAKEQAAKRKKK